MANLKIEGKGKTGQGSNGKAINRRAERQKTNTGRADINTATSGWLHAAICAVAGAGGAFRIGYTQDGGAIAIGIYMDGNVEKLYLTPKDSLDEFLEEVYNDFRSDEVTPNDVGGN